MTATSTATYSYTTEDVEIFFRRFRADIFMIADSTGAITREDAEKYAHDTEYLAARGYVAKVDVTLLSYGVEIKAAGYRANENADAQSSDRPRGVLWPKVPGAKLRVVISYTNAYMHPENAITVATAGKAARLLIAFLIRPVGQ